MYSFQTYSWTDCVCVTVVDGVFPPNDKSIIKGIAFFCNILAYIQVCNFTCIWHNFRGDKELQIVRFFFFRMRNWDTTFSNMNKKISIVLQQHTKLTYECIDEILLKMFLRTILHRYEVTNKTERMRKSHSFNLMYRFKNVWFH